MQIANSIGWTVLVCQIDRHASAPTFSLIVLRCPLLHRFVAGAVNLLPLPGHHLYPVREIQMASPITTSHNPDP